MKAALKNQYFKSCYPNGTIEQESYCLNGKWHREKGPAHIEYYEDGSIEREIYVLNRKWHREDGPAFILYRENGTIKKERYYLRGEEILDDFRILVIQGLGMEIK